MQINNTVEEGKKPNGWYDIAKLTEPITVYTVGYCEAKTNCRCKDQHFHIYLEFYLPTCNAR